MIEKHKNMMFSEYLATEALSYSGIKKILESPLDFWDSCSWLNPACKPQESEGMMVGTLLHELAFEGRKWFQGNYTVKPEPQDFPGVEFMFKQADYKEYCRNYGLPVGGTNPALLERIFNHDPGAPVWDFTITAWRKKYIESLGLVEIDRADMDHVNRMAKAIERNEFAVSALEGEKEISFLWEKEGVKIKTRLDCLKIEGDRAFITDLKSFKPRKGRNIQGQIRRRIMEYHYDLQAAVNMEAVHEYHGIPYSNIEFKAVFVRSGDVNQSYVIEYPGAASQLMHRARMMFSEGVRVYGECLRHYADGGRWDADNKIQRLEDDDFPPWYLEG